MTGTVGQLLDSEEMALQRDDHGRFRRPAEYDSAEFRADLLLRQRTSDASVRELAAETDRSKSSIATDLKRARHEERAQLDAERTLTQPVQPEHERKPRPRALVLPRSRYREGLAAVLESNEHVHLERVANVRAGLSAAGMATYETSNGRGSYDPADAQDVARVRDIIRDDDGDEAADRWLPHPGL